MAAWQDKAPLWAIDPRGWLAYKIQDAAQALQRLANRVHDDVAPDLFAAGRESERYWAEEQRRMIRAATERALTAAQTMESVR